MKPTQPSDYIGKTGRIARAMFDKIPAIQNGQTQHVLERCQLFTGPPGVGKTSLAEAFAAALAGHPLAIERTNGQSCTIDLVREWRNSGVYRPLFGKISVKLVDEIDAASSAAANELRSYLDHLPEHMVFLATTNKSVDQLQEQLQSRFQVWKFSPVPADTLATWLVEKFKITAHRAQEIALTTEGNVRAAIGDALTTLNAQNA
jgi:DNA polymerase III subunit delta'